LVAVGGLLFLLSARPRRSGVEDAAAHDLDMSLARAALGWAGKATPPR
jgi:hypothetical protein